MALFGLNEASGWLPASPVSNIYLNVLFVCVRVCVYYVPASFVCHFLFTAFVFCLFMCLFELEILSTVVPYEKKYVALKATHNEPKVILHWHKQFCLCVPQF